jgi:hypothetical protein
MQREGRYEAIVQMLLDREADDREAREKRQLGYKQYLESVSGLLGSSPSRPGSHIRLSKFRTKVPCRVTPEARALLDQLEKDYSGSTVTFLEVTSRRQAVMLSGGARAEPKQIGWIEHGVQTDPGLCNVRHQGLAVETDGGSMLVLRFLYPRTAVTMSSRPTRVNALVSGSQVDALQVQSDECDGVARVDFSEIRPALDLPPSNEDSSPRIVWVTRSEAETMDALGSREYEAFYVRLKLEVQAGIWDTLSGLLASSPAWQWHLGSYYSVLWEPDGTNGRIYQRTVDDSGNAVDIGLDRTYDASTATDILLLYLGGDILAGFADIYFSLESLSSPDACPLKEEFFALIRRFWASTPSLAARYGNELAAVVRMSQRAVPTPAQALLLRQDWTNLRQSLIDRYGEGGRRAADLMGQDVYRPRSGSVPWPFASFPAGEVNVGLRVVYRQEWRHLGVLRGEVIRTAPLVCEGETRTGPNAGELRGVETTIEHCGPTRNLNEIVAEAADATVKAVKWPLEVEGSINTGLRCLAATTGMGLESECRESSRDTSTRLTDIMRRMASKVRNETSVVAGPENTERFESPFATDLHDPTDPDAATCVYSRLQNQYEILTQPAEIQNVILVAEELPTLAEINLSWVKLHDWILAQVLLDESYRAALNSIRVGTRPHDSSVSAADLELDAMRERLYEHLRANILYYQRAIWQHEDPQQRSMRYRKSGKKVPLEWRFELESAAALTIAELRGRLTASNVDGQFAAYSTGREADLDQVIDPARPIGYYGNYAIYQMRPEFGCEDLFSMLHFFKAPWLRPHPETGEPEVADPRHIQISDDPAIRTAAAAADLFRRERTRRIALDTDSVIVDIIRNMKHEHSRNPSAADMLETLNTYALILENGPGIELLSTNGHREQDADCLITARSGERTPSLLAGAARPAGRADARALEPVILDREAGLMLTVAGAGPAELHQCVISTGGAGVCRPGLLAGAGAARPYDQDAEPVILAQCDEERTPNLRAGARAHAEAGRLILPRGEVESTTMLHAGAAGALDAEGDGVIVVRAPAELAPCLIAGVAVAAHDPNARRVIVAENDGKGTTSLLAGARAARAHDPEAARLIFAQDDERLRPSLVAG